MKTYTVSEITMMGETFISLVASDGMLIPADILNMDFYDALKAYKLDESVFTIDASVTNIGRDLLEGFVSRI